MLINFLHKFIGYYKSNAIFSAAIMGIVVSLVLFLFRPFGLRFLYLIDYIIVISFGFITFMSIIFADFLSMKALKRFPKLKKFSTDFIIALTLISFFNQLFISYLNEQTVSILKTVLYTLVIGLIPITVELLIDLKSRLIGLEEKNISSDEETVQLISSSNKCFEIIIRNLIYIQSEDNYISIYYLNENSELKSELLRMTLSKSESSLKGYPFFRCHRSFLINFNYIKEIKSTKNGYFVLLSSAEEKVPVSRRYVRDLKQIVENTNYILN